MRVLLRLGQALAALDAPEEAMAEVDETLFDGLRYSEAFRRAGAGWDP